MTKILRTTAASIFLLVVIVVAKLSLEHHLAPSTSGLQGELRTPNVEVLLIGSSHMRQSYEIAELQRVIGTNAFVVAYDGLDPSSMKLLLQEILGDSSQHLKLIVLDGYCELYAHKPDIEDARLFFDVPPSVKLKLIQEYARETGSWHAWPDIWDLAVNRGNDTILTWPLVHSTVDSLSYHGAYRRKSMAGMDTRNFASLRVPLATSHLNEEQETALRDMIGMIKLAHIKLLLVDAPVPEPVEIQENVVAIKRQLISLSDSEGVPFYDGAIGFPIDNPALFSDSNHLSTDGRALYTDRFAKMILAHAADFDLARTQAP